MNMISSVWIRKYILTVDSILITNRLYQNAGYGIPYCLPLTGCVYCVLVRLVSIESHAVAHVGYRELHEAFRTPSIV